VMSATLLLHHCYLHDRTWRRRHAVTNRAVEVPELDR
jgi:hypothetical protein